MDTTTILLLMTGFVVKHLMADFALQNPWMAENKYLPFHIAGWIHAFIHGVGTFLVLSFAPITMTMMVSLSILDMMVHHAIDLSKMNITRAFSLTPKDWTFWLFIGIDQMLHYLTYLFILYEISS